MKNKIKAGIMGAGGFTGQELIKIFSRHPGVDLVWITSDAYKGLPLNQVLRSGAHPAYSKLAFSAHPEKEQDIPPLDVLFLAVPDETSLHWIDLLSKSSLRIIDISGAFRLKNPEDYKKYYGFTHSRIDLLNQVVYGLPEVNCEKIKNAKIVANPGCYATAAILPVLFMKNLLGNCESKIILDAKSGTSGAGGRKEKDNLPFSHTNENFRAYKIKSHQHIPEIVEQIGPVFQSPVYLNMTPHLLPLFRGLQTNMYVYLKSDPDIKKITAEMHELSEREPFIRYYEEPEKIELRNVQNTNYLDFSFYYDSNSRLVQIISVLDNLQKGAAGQAVQNLNLMFGLPEHQGLL